MRERSESRAREGFFHYIHTYYVCYSFFDNISIRRAPLIFLFYGSLHRSPSLALSHARTHIARTYCVPSVFPLARFRSTRHVIFYDSKFFFFLRHTHTIITSLAVSVESAASKASVGESLDRRTHALNPDHSRFAAQKPHALLYYLRPSRSPRTHHKLYINNNKIIHYDISLLVIFSIKFRRAHPACICKEPTIIIIMFVFRRRFFLMIFIHFFPIKQTNIIEITFLTIF